MSSDALEQLVSFVGEMRGNKYYPSPLFRHISAEL